MLKSIIKKILSRIACYIHSITTGTNCKIGYNIKTTKCGQISIGNNVQISCDSLLLNVTKQARITIGDNCRFAHHLQISCAHNVTINDNVNIAPFVFITDHNHEYRDINFPIKDQGIMIDDGDSIVIGEDTWIGTKATIIGNIHIGKHCVIAANSVITKDIPDYSIAAGIPAKIIKRYNFKTNQWENL